MVAIASSIGVKGLWKSSFGAICDLEKTLDKKNNKLKYKEGNH